MPPKNSTRPYLNEIKTSSTSIYITTTLLMGIKYEINAYLFLHLNTSIMRDIVTITRNVLKAAKKTSVYILETELPQGHS